jgi:DNA-binding MarR family transcriptional regulator
MELWLQLDLTMPQFAALHAVWRRGPISGRQLAEQLGVTPPAIVKVASRLEARGYIERLQDTRDRRVQRFRLTASGMAVLEKVIAVNREHLAPALNRLSSEDRTALAKILNELAHAIKHQGNERGAFPVGDPTPR